ncbi:response regulator [Lachnoclostridium phytofermentans]|uniref:Stage 0 sporulation protein A homolog n=1 Tax=Lachnoclostridium phytofermentans (strain ATCC 700394 / DSM 18823 / ISDg) TaxID=357809 RepID=A9KJF7_LACP7|nr:response regulator transcription factor [Lachnoclostridium phytofermentans]ABX43977.1 two component transcriptional regulator, LuxR family [Lachnoclostridium phytofermentans ISDg]
MNTKYKVLLVDDETLLLESLEIILTLSEEYEIVGKARNGLEALECINHIVPDLAMIDLNMETIGGLELIRNIRNQYDSMKILVLTTFYDERNITLAMQYGANGYLLKDSGRNAILTALLNIRNGQSVIDQKVLETLTKLISDKKSSKKSNTIASLTNLDSPQNIILPLSELTKREHEICAMIAEGFTNSQIASFLYISEGTVKNYISSIYDKLQIHDRAALAVALTKTNRII